MAYTAGTRIPVLVGGRPYETVVAADGRQRFVEDPENLLVKRLKHRWSGAIEINRDGDVEDLNEMAIRYHRKEFDQRAYAEFNMALGYSMDGFCELSSFFDMDVESPIGTPYRVGWAAED